jgi:hypothetical protein
MMRSRRSLTRLRHHGYRQVAPRGSPAAPTTRHGFDHFGTLQHGYGAITSTAARRSSRMARIEHHRTLTPTKPSGSWPRAGHHFLSRTRYRLRSTCAASANARVLYQDATRS